MIQTAIVEARVTAENVDEFTDTIQARPQQREIKIGDVISHYLDDNGETEVTIWHKQRRAAICYYKGESEWGDWDGSRVKLDRYGRALDKDERF
jgi:hypothetical protein